MVGFKIAYIEQTEEYILAQSWYRIDYAWLPQSDN